MRYLIILALFFAACNTPKKLNKVMNKLPEAAAKECAIRFPIKESIDTVTVIDSAMLQVYEMEFVYLYHIVDSLLGEQVNDSIKKEIITVFQEKKVPVIKYKYITKTQESTAKCQVKIDSLNKIINTNLSNFDKLEKTKDLYLIKYSEEVKQSDKYKSQRNRYLWIIITLLLWIFRRPIFRIFKKIITKN